MKKYIASAKNNKIKTNPYLDINYVFKEGEFDDDEFFNTVEEIFYENNVRTDDLKANISVREYPEDGPIDAEVDVRATFSWIFYPEDIPKKDFKKEAKRIEKIFNDIYGKSYFYECDVVRYDDSEYSSHGYDVEMRFRNQFKFEGQ